MYSGAVPENLNKHVQCRGEGWGGGMQSIHDPVAVGTPTIILEFCHQPEMSASLTIVPASLIDEICSTSG